MRAPRSIRRPTRAARGLVEFDRLCPPRFVALTSGISRPQQLRGLAAAPGAQAAPASSHEAPSADPAAVPAPIVGTVQAWMVEDGAQVAEGELIAVMEAMKMEMQVLAHRTGCIRVKAAAGAYVAAASELARIE
ncbi:MAG: acetyl-CoA carboxylase biotin carboxyl carrier protein subunit [Proteobacteria bacterium]|nr:acetyl-CoA carboxylase biotin carboxyl carrier protein subunit [Pseudomonadota bacterium]